jgi:hypothetical protein
LTDIEGREKLGVLVCLPQTIQSTWHTLPYESKNKSRRKQQIKDYLIFYEQKKSQIQILKIYRFILSK